MHDGIFVAHTSRLNTSLIKESVRRRILLIRYVARPVVDREYAILHAAVNHNQNETGEILGRRLKA